MEPYIDSRNDGVEKSDAPSSVEEKVKFN